MFFAFRKVLCERHTIVTIYIRIEIELQKGDRVRVAQYSQQYNDGRSTLNMAFSSHVE